jgi:site-specific recombinase XerD
VLKRIEERSHVPGIHPHRFRHTLATNLIDRGMSVQEVAVILGHANLDTTMTYIHVNEKNTENAYRKYACM